MLIVNIVTILAAWLVATEALAKSAEQVYREAAPSVVVVEATLTASGFIGSGVVIAPGEVITNCHVIDDARKISVISERKRYSASVRYADKVRDLCQIHVDRLPAPSVDIASQPARIGQRVYAIGNPNGLERTLSDGLVSSIRSMKADYQMLQISTPITFGSSGGGLFDEDAKLVGITTSGMSSGNLNFAIPAELIASLRTNGERKADVTAEQLTALSDAIRISRADFVILKG